MILKQLNERDGRAIDAILMNGRTMNSSVPPVAISAGDVSPDAFRAASKILRLLDAMEPDAVGFKELDDHLHGLRSAVIARIGRSDGGRAGPDGIRPAAGDSNIA